MMAKTSSCEPSESDGRRRSRIVAVAGVLIAVLGCVVPSLGRAGRRTGTAPAPAPDDGANAPTFSAPTVDLDRTEVRVGESIRVAIAGFSSISVTTTICGNQGLRGSSDCNVAGAEAVETDRTSVTDISFIINTPPTACPCVIRVASPNNDEVAIADIVLLDHPIAELVVGSVIAQPLSVELVAEPRAVGLMPWARSSLGGATTYDVRLTIRNRSPRPVERVSVDGAVGRDVEDVRAQLEFPQPGLIEANGTWEQVIQVDLPAPVYGNAAWRVAVASANPTIAATDTTSHLPGLLLLFIVFLVADLVYILIRLINRRRRRGRAKKAPAEPERGRIVEENRVPVGAPVMQL